MQTKLFIASLLLGTSTLAAAAPGDYAGAPVDDCEHDGGAPAGYSDYQPGYPGQVSYPAQPGTYQSQYPQQYQAQYPAQYPARYPAYDQPRWGGERFRRPVMLASDLQFDGRGRRFISVGPQAGRFARLELKAQQGRTFIKQVYVQFDDGQEQVVRDIDRVVSRRNGLTLDLDGGRRGIRRIVVYGEGQQRRAWGYDHRYDGRSDNRMASGSLTVVGT